MLVTVRLFARLREIAGASELRAHGSGRGHRASGVGSLAGEFPALGDYASAISCAVNDEYSRLTTTLEDGDEVAFLPPVSGG